MKLPQLTKLRKEDLGDTPAWFDKVIYSFNRLADAVYNSLNGALTVKDNLSGKVFELDIQTTDLPYKIDSQKVITDLWVSSIREVSGSRADFTTAVWADWVYDASTTNLVIYNISGLTAGKRYKIRLVGFAEA